MDSKIFRRFIFKKLHFKKYDSKKRERKRAFNQSSNYRRDGAEAEDRQRGNILARTGPGFRRGRAGGVTQGHTKLLQFIEVEVVSRQK